MSDAAQPEETPERVGRTRTHWHPIFAQILTSALQDAYEVRKEAPVGKLPLEIDALLLRRAEGNLSQIAQEDLAELLPRLAECTIIELKGPTDALEQGDWETVNAYALLYLAQEGSQLANEDLSLVFLAPTLNRSFRQSLTQRGLTAQELPNERGTHEILGGMFRTWLIETDRMAESLRPVLTLFSRVFLQNHRRIIDQLRSSGHERALYFVLQQIQQIRFEGEDWTMAYQNVEELDQITQELKQAVLQGMTPEERVAGLTPEQLKQAVLKGLTAQQREQLKQLLERQGQDEGQSGEE